MNFKAATDSAPSVRNKIAGRIWYYDFHALSEIDNVKCTAVVHSMLQRYAKVAKTWTPDLNSAWTCRLYMAAKLIMSATLHSNACDFSEEKNLRVVTPYLRYYTVLSLLRAVCYTLPEFQWGSGDLIQISHAKAIQGAIAHIRQFDAGMAERTDKEIRLLKAERELISYRAPSAGDQGVVDHNEFLGLCRLLAEVAQFNSELLVAAGTNMQRFGRFGNTDGFWTSNPQSRIDFGLNAGAPQTSICP